MTSVEEHLTTGWEQHAPVEDTLLRTYLFHSVALAQAFAVGAGGAALDGPDFGAAERSMHVQQAPRRPPVDST